MNHYTELAKIAPLCFGCRNPSDGTIVLAHRNMNGWGMLAGRGIKSIAIGGSFLDAECHTYGDGQGQTDYHWWSMANQRALTWAWQSGYLRFEPNGGEPDKRLR